MCRRTPRRDGAHQPFDDDRVLVTLVLQPQGVFRRIDEIGDAFAAIVGAPNELRMLAGVEFLALPVRLEARYHLVDFGLLCRDHRVIAGDGQVACFPVEGFDKSNRCSSITIDF